MALTTLNVAWINGEVLFRHEICTKTDATFFYNVDEEGIESATFKVDSSGYLYAKNALIGKFKMRNHNLWIYEGNDGTVIETGNVNLIKAEMKVFKKLLGNMNGTEEN